jgi:hypothetical protein
MDEIIKPPIIYTPEIYNADMAELHFDIIKDILKAKPVLHYGEKGLSYVYNRRRYNTE